MPMVMYFITYRNCFYHHFIKRSIQLFPLDDTICLVFDAILMKIMITLMGTKLITQPVNDLFSDYDSHTCFSCSCVYNIFTCHACQWVCRPVDIPNSPNSFNICPHGHSFQSADLGRSGWLMKLAITLIPCSS